MTEKEKRLLVENVISAPSTCAELRQIAAEWLKAAGTEREAELTKLLVAEAEEDINSAEDTLAFLESEMGAKIFGKEEAERRAELQKERIAAGEKYCDCPGCLAAKAIIENKEKLFV